MSTPISRLLTGASDDRIVFDNGRIRGECWAIASDTLYLWFGFAATPASNVTEMIQLSADGRHGARIWHWFRDGALEKVTLVREQRVAEWTFANAQYRPGAVLRTCSCKELPR